MNNTVSDTEERIQGRLVTFFQDALGYEYLGDWQSRENNSNIDKTLLTKWLRTQRHNAVGTLRVPSPNNPQINTKLTQKCIHKCV